MSFLNINTAAACSDSFEEMKETIKGGEATYVPLRHGRPLPSSRSVPRTAPLDRVYAGPWNGRSDD
jgi:hypothetical protein